MDREDVEPLVDADQVLVLRVKAAGGRQESDECGGVDWDYSFPKVLVMFSFVLVKWKGEWEMLCLPKPAAGVMPTRPEMIPEQKPMMLNFLV